MISGLFFAFDCMKTALLKNPSFPSVRTNILIFELSPARNTFLSNSTFMQPHDTSALYKDRGFAPEFAILTFNSTISCRNVFTFPKSTVFELMFKTAALSLFMRYSSSVGELLPFLLHELHIKIKKNNSVW